MHLSDDLFSSLAYRRIDLPQQRISRISRFLSSRISGQVGTPLHEKDRMTSQKARSRFQLGSVDAKSYCLPGARKISPTMIIQQEDTAATDDYIDTRVQQSDTAGWKAPSASCAHTPPRLSRLVRTAAYGVERAIFLRSQPTETSLVAP